MDRYQVIPRTSCFVFHEDKVLMLKANNTKDWTGIYDPVGGHIEVGEDVLASGLREIKEESGLDVIDAKIRGVIHVTNFFSKNIMLFVITAVSNSIEVVANHEGELHWISLDQLDTIPTFDDIKPILKRIHQDNIFFSGRSVFEDGKLVELLFNS